MKVICINNDGKPHLTIGKIYDVCINKQANAEDAEIYFYIKCDNGSIVDYFKYRFLELYKWRDLQINSILDEK